MTDSLTVLHISDFHIQRSNFQASKRRLDELCKTVLTAGRPDIVLATGDIAYHGYAEEYELAEELLIALVSNLSIERQQLVLVPGNHDVDRRLVDPVQDLGLQSMAKVQPDQVAAFITDRPADALGRQKPYFDFMERLGATAEPHIFRCNSLTVGCAPLNSAWRASSDNDPGQLFIGSEQMQRAVERIRSADVRIALFHHPIESLHTSEQRQIPILLGKWFHIVCCGHNHSVDSHLRRYTLGDTYFSVAKAIDAKEWELGFSVLQIAKDESLLSKHFRWEERRLEYVPDTELSNSASHAVEKLALGPLAGDLAHVQQESLSLASQALSLVTQRITQLAPKLSTSGVFSHFEPPLRIADRRTRLPLKIVIDSSTHWVIAGGAFSGKTTTLQLLHDAFACKGETVRMISSNDITPQSHNIVDALRDILKVSGNRVREMLSNGMVLLVDDLKSSHQSFPQLMNLLQEWTKSQSKLRLIVSVENIPLVKQESDYGSWPNWQNAELQSIDLDDICILAERCQGAGLLKLDSAITVRNLIAESFQSELPRFPWVVLLFLELCCTGERVAGVGLALLLDRYIELQLNRMESDRSTLSSDIGGRGLMLLADRLFQTTRTSMPKQEFEGILQLEFKRAALIYNPGEALDSLCRIGMLQGTGDSVSFTLSAFLDYFYAKHILYSGEVIPTEFTPQYLRRRAGALAIVAALRSGSGLALAAFNTALSIAPSSVKTVSLESLTLEAIKLSEEAFDLMDESSIKNRQTLDAELAKLEDSATKRNATESQGESSHTKTFEFMECYIAALFILRSSAFADAETKEKCVTAAVDLTMGIAASFHEFMSALDTTMAIWVNADTLPKNERMKAVSMLTVFLLLITNTILGVAGGSQHLEQTLVQSLSNERDEARALTLIMWLSLINPSRAVSLTEQYLKRKVSYSSLTILALWLMAQYGIHSMMERRKDARWREAFRRAARAVTERTTGTRDQRTINNATDRMIRSVERRFEP